MNIIDKELWGAIIALTAILYGIKWLIGRRKVKVYRISPKSLERSKRVILRVLPLTEDGDHFPLDDQRLPYPKDNVKSAAKILAYYYWKENRQEELMRIKACFIALSRFQSTDLETDTREKKASRDKKRLTREFECYITHSSSPHNANKAA